MECSIKIYNTIIKPHFEYCSTILFLGSEGRISRLQKLQNMGMRCILKCHRLTHIRDMLNTLSWLSIKQRTLMNVIIFIFKLRYNLLPGYLHEFVNFVSDVQPYLLRNNLDFRTPNLYTAESQNSLVYKGLNLFNSLPISLKSELNFVSFKRQLILYIKERFSITQ